MTENTMTPQTPSGQQAVEQSDAERYGPSFDRALMGTPQAADAELARLSAEYRDLRKPFMGSAKAIKQRQLREREVLFNLGHAALLWLWHREDATPIAPSTAAGEMAFVCGCGWDGSYADMNETVEGMTCPKCRLGRNLDCAAALATPPAQEGERTALAQAIYDRLFDLRDSGEEISELHPHVQREVDAIMRVIETTPPAPSVPWEERAALAHDKLAREYEGIANKFGIGAVAVSAYRLADFHQQSATYFRALLSKSAKGEGE